MTWIEVADSAIKIGLGALLAGLFAVLTSRLSLERDARKRYAERKRDLIERAIDKLVEFEKAYRHQKAAFDDLMVLEPSFRTGTKRQQNFDTLDEKLRVTAEIFAEVTGILLVIGEPAVESFMETYRSLCGEWREKSLANLSQAQAAELMPLRQKIVRTREEFMAKLALSYKDE